MRSAEEETLGTDGGGGPVEGLADDPGRGEWPGIVLRSVLALAVLVGAYVGVAHYVGARIPNGTTVHGVGIGTLTPGAALERLEDRLEPLRTDPVTVRAGSEELALQPGAAGLALDLAATLDGVTEVSYDPLVLWRRLADDGTELPLVADVDTVALEQALQEHATAFDAEPREGDVQLTLGRVRSTPPEAGRRLDVRATAAAVEEGWPLTRSVTGTVRAVPPQVGAEELERFVSAEAEPALASSVLVTEGEQESRLTPNELSRLLTAEAGPDGALRLVLDEAGLLDAVRGDLTATERPPRDATVRLGEDGRPEVVPARAGRELDEESLTADVTAALTSAERTVEAQTASVPPDVTDEDAETWVVDEVMSEFRSAFPTGRANADRTENIRVGLRHVNGSVVMPGEQFSLADALSPITEARGYVRAGVIADGRLVQGLGGGLSQVSTTVLNAAWLAGVRLDEFTPHSYYIPRYPEGREATISVPLIDNRWTNDTDSPVVVEATISGDEIVMRFWGDRRFTVETVTGPRRNVVPPGQGTDDSPDCLPQSPQEGFDVTVTRVLSRGGEEVDRQAYTTRYQPSDEVRCTHSGGGR